MTTGPTCGQVVELEPMLEEYYHQMGWDSQGVPTREQLTSLGLEILLEGTARGKELKRWIESTPLKEDT
jgi:aldehyde:ferredoxin oxidoreductase